MMILSQYHIFELDTINIYSVGSGQINDQQKKMATLREVRRKAAKASHSRNTLKYQYLAICVCVMQMEAGWTLAIL
jgi:hypothetical protein